MAAAECYVTSPLWNSLVYEVRPNLPKKAAIIAQFVYEHQSNIIIEKFSLKIQ